MEASLHSMYIIKVIFEWKLWKIVHVSSIYVTMKVMMFIKIDVMYEVWMEYIYYIKSNGM